MFLREKIPPSQDVSPGENLPFTGCFSGRKSPLHRMFELGREKLEIFLFPIQTSCDNPLGVGGGAGYVTSL
jgi:hypothetical protein